MIDYHILVMVLSVCIASVSQILLKKSAMKSHASFIKEYLNPLVICGYGFLAVSVLLTTYAYSGMDYKNGPVIESLGNVFVLLLGHFIIGERITSRKIAGIVCIIAGMAVFYT